MYESIAIDPPTQPLRFFEQTLARIEWFRVRNHLRIVEQELLQKKDDDLSFELRQSRIKNITHLHDYWAKGLFPRNLDFLDRRVPYFKDDADTPCAMAYLIEQSGHQDLVDTVVRSNNHIYINDVHDGPVMDWINNSGLTKAEAARVQPNYGPCGWGGCTHPIIEILPWIASAVGFILLEWMSYKISSWLIPGNRKRRLVTWLYFTMNNLLIAAIFNVIVMVLISQFARVFRL